MLQRQTSIAAIGALLTVAASGSAQCRADIDRNGSLDLRDLQHFQALLQAQERRADLNRDGAHDIFDLLEYHNRFAAGCTSSAGSDSSGGTLYLGVGDHWKGSPNEVWTTGQDFGPTDLSYRWLTQTELVIRPAKRYPNSGEPEAGTGAQMIHAYVAEDTAPYDPLPHNQFALRIHRDGAFHYGWDAFDRWVDLAEAGIATSLEHDPLSSGRKLLLDNESLMFLGWYWGETMNRLLPEHETHQAIDAHTDEFMQYGIAFLEELQLLYPNDEISWYNIPSKANRQKYPGPYTNYDGELYRPLWSPSPPPGGTYPWWKVDPELEPLLEASDYVDGQVYTNDDWSDWKEWLEGQIRRKKAIADDLQKPFMARIWLENKDQDSLLQSKDFLETFFEHCKDFGVTEASCDAGREWYECAAAMAGMNYGQLWRTHVVDAAIDSGFLNAPPISDLTLVNVTPDSAKAGETITDVKLRGSGFTSNTAISLSGSGATFSNVTVVSDELITADLTVADAAATGVREMSVSENDTWAVDGGFEIRGSSDPAWPPELLCLLPDTIKVGDTAIIRVAGRHFQEYSMAVVSPSTDITVDSYTVENSKYVEVEITVAPGAQTGERELQIWHLDGMGAATITIVD